MWMSVQCSTIRFGSNPSCPVPQRRSFALGRRIGLARCPPRRALVCRQPVVLGVHNVVVSAEASNVIRISRSMAAKIRSQHGQDGCLVPDSMRARVDWTTRAASATSRCDMPAFARATLPGPVRLQQATPRTGPYPWAWLIGVLGADTSVRDDDLWVVESTPLKCARRPRVKRSDLAGWAQGRSSRSVLAAT